MKVLITSGGTTVPIDDARRITNMSSGRFGSEIAKAAILSQNNVIHLYAQDSKTPFDCKLDVRKNQTSELRKVLETYEMYSNYAEYYSGRVYKTFDEYKSQVESIIRHESPDIIILAAAVSDYGVVKSDGKISSDLDKLNLKMEKLPKVINRIRYWSTRSNIMGQRSYIVGFKLLCNATKEELLEAAYKSERLNDTDLIVANDLKDLKNNKHKLYLVQNQQLVKELDGDQLASHLWVFIENDWKNRK